MGFQQKLIHNDSIVHKSHEDNNRNDGDVADNTVQTEYAYCNQCSTTDTNLGNWWCRRKPDNRDDDDDGDGEGDAGTHGGMDETGGR